MDGDGQTSASVDEDLVKQPLMEPRSADSAAAGWSMWLGYSPREKYDDDDDDDDLVVDPLSKHEANGKKEQPDEEDEDKAPLGLLMGVKGFCLCILAFVNMSQAFSNNHKNCGVSVHQSAEKQRLPAGLPTLSDEYGSFIDQLSLSGW